MSMEKCGKREGFFLETGQPTHELCSLREERAPV